MTLLIIITSVFVPLICLEMVFRFREASMRRRWMKNPRTKVRIPKRFVEETRASRPPEELVGALQDRVHRESGALRAAKSVRSTLTNPSGTQVTTLTPEAKELLSVAKGKGFGRIGQDLDKLMRDFDRAARKGRK
jgi:hypothetical protein